MSDSPDNTTKPYVRIEVSFVDDTGEYFDVPLQVGERYATYQQIAFMNGILLHEEWFTAEDIDGIFHAIRVERVKSIICELVTNDQ